MQRIDSSTHAHALAGPERIYGSVPRLGSEQNRPATRAQVGVCIGFWECVEVDVTVI